VVQTSERETRERCRELDLLLLFAVDSDSFEGNELAYGSHNLSILVADVELHRGVADSGEKAARRVPRPRARLAEPANVGGLRYGPAMEMLPTGAEALIAAIALAFIALVATKAAAGLWFIVTVIGRGLYWATIGWWVNRIKHAVMG